MKNIESIGPYVRAYKCSACGNVSYPYAETWVRWLAVAHEVCPKCAVENAYTPIIGRVTTITKKRLWSETVERFFTELNENKTNPR